MFTLGYLKLINLTCRPLIKATRSITHRNFKQKNICILFILFKDPVTAVNTQMDTAAAANLTIGEKIEQHLFLHMIRKKSKKESVTNVRMLS